MSLAWVWFVLVGVLIMGYAMLDGFDLGIGVLSPFLARDERERSALRSIIGPVWDGNEVWLITAGGALFAAFPFAYAFAFSGFYLAIMLVLFGLILRAVSLEMRHRDERWSRLWDVAFFLGSFLPALLLGCAVGNIIRGVPMQVSVTGVGGGGPDYAGTFWQLLNPYSLLVAVTGLAMFVTQGAAWAALKSTGELRDRTVKVRSWSQLAFVVLVAATTVATLFVIRAQVHDGITSVWGWLALIVFVAGIALARWSMARDRDVAAFAWSSVAVAGLIGLWGAGFWPYLIRPRGGSFAAGIQASQLHSSSYTLGWMLGIALVFVPIVLVYIAFVYRIFRGRIAADSVDY
jgi:cytochrome d ubiquinol oxidase subunit II